jgi:ATP-dependent Zn protease
VRRTSALSRRIDERETALKIDAEIKRIITVARVTARQILTERGGQVETIAKRPLEDKSSARNSGTRPRP